MKIGDVFIDLNKGNFYTKPIKKKVNLSGGIVLDSTDCQWIKHISELIKKSRYSQESTARSKIGMNTNSTLVVCNQQMLQIWKNILGPTFKTKIISRKRDHSNVTYQQLIDSDVTIVTFEYITNKLYSKNWEEYKINNNTSINEIFSIMRKELSRCEKTYEKNNPVFSLIKWKRLVIDNSTLKNLTNNKDFFNLINGIKSKYRWLQIKEFPFMRNELMIFLDILNRKDDHDGNYSIKFPIYDNSDNIHYLKDVIRKIEISGIQSSIKTNIVPIKMNEYENMLYKKLRNLYGNKTLEEIGNILINFKTKKELISNKIYNKKWKYSNECSICMSKICKNNFTILKCGHYFCLPCITEVMCYNFRCPFCRKKIDSKCLYTVSRIPSVLSKFNKLNNLLKNDSKLDSTKLILYAPNIKLATGLFNFLKQKSIKSFLCIGRIQKKNNIISKFNDLNDGTIILTMDDYKLSKGIKGVSKVYFLGEREIKEKNINEYCGYSFINKEFGSINLFYLIYDLND